MQTSLELTTISSILGILLLYFNYLIDRNGNLRTEVF